jgi:hypothetical protein
MKRKWIRRLNPSKFHEIGVYRFRGDDKKKGLTDWAKIDTNERSDLG